MPWLICCVFAGLTLGFIDRVCGEEPAAGPDRPLVQRSNPDFGNATPRTVRGRLAPTIELKADTESAKAAPNNEEIDRLVAELGSADFRAREQATEKLIAAGPAAIDAVAKALKNDDFETSVRALRVMQAGLDGQNRAAQLQAAHVLESLTKNEDGALSGLASDAIEMYRLTQQDRAVAALRRLGAVVRADDPILSGTGSLVVELKSEWRGHPADFEYLKQIPDMGFLNIINVRLDSTSLKTMGELTQLYGVKLYGTGVSADETAELGQKLPGVAIERRSGGLLGIRGMRGETPCRVADVPEGTAASAADIRADDIILSIDGRSIQSFDELYTLVGEKKGGDHVKLEIRRDGQAMVKDVTLGQWQ